MSQLKALCSYWALNAICLPILWGIYCLYTCLTCKWCGEKTCTFEGLKRKRIRGKVSFEQKKPVFSLTSKYFAVGVVFFLISFIELSYWYYRNSQWNPGWFVLGCFFIPLYVAEVFKWMETVLYKSSHRLKRKQKTLKPSPILRMYCCSL